MNTFMNFVKKSLAGGRTKDGVGAFRGVEASSLPLSNLAPASLSYFPGMLVGRLTQELRQVVKDPRAIVKV